jgi:hypothetical protein
MGNLTEDVRSAFADLLPKKCRRFRLNPHRELRGRLLAVAVVSVALDVTVTLVLLVLDKTGLGTSFVWTTSELLTGGAGVSISHFWPHYFELALQIWAVTAIAALAGSFGAFFHRLATAQ